MKKNLIVLFVTMLSFLNLNTIISADDSIEVKQTEVGSEFTHHIEVITKTLDGKDIPHMGAVLMTVVDKENNYKGEQVPLHPMFGSFFHYGVNVKVEDKPYTLKFEFHPPTFMRDINSKDKWIEHFDGEVEFDPTLDYSQGVVIGTQKTSDMDITYMVFEAKSMYEIAHKQKEHHEDNHMEEDAFKKDKSDSSNLAAYSGLLILGMLLGGAGTFAFINLKKK